MFYVTGNMHVSLSLTDAGGRQLQSLLDGNVSQGNHSVKLNTSHLYAGIYYVKLITDKDVQHVQLIVEK